MGYFYYREYPFIRAKTPMLHWAQATTYNALSVLLMKLTIDRDRAQHGRERIWDVNKTLYH